MFMVNAKKLRMTCIRCRMMSSFLIEVTYLTQLTASKCVDDTLVEEEAEKETEDLEAQNLVSAMPEIINPLMPNVP